MSRDTLSNLKVFVASLISLAVICTFIGCDSKTPAKPARMTILSNGQHVAYIDGKDATQEWLEANKDITIVSITWDYNYESIIVFTRKAEKQ